MDINPYVKAVKDFSSIYEEAYSLKSNWCVLFSNNNLINLDIGCGNGEYLNYLARNNPEKYYVGLELQYKEIYRACKRVQDLSNVKIIRVDAKDIDKTFLENTINNVNIWFPDPWFKRKQTKHRLINSNFIDKLYLLLNKDSKVSIKTDNELYFNIILALFQTFKSKLEVLNYSYDIYGESYMVENNYKTAFERIFLAQNLKIKHLLINRV